MKRSVNSLIGYTLHATDGEIGEVKEFYFDDQTSTIRYMIVKTGGWLLGKEVLISPQALEKPDWETKTFPVNLTKEQIKTARILTLINLFPVNRKNCCMLIIHGQVIILPLEIGGVFLS